MVLIVTQHPITGEELNFQASLPHQHNDFTCWKSCKLLYSITINLKNNFSLIQMEEGLRLHVQLAAGIWAMYLKEKVFQHPQMSVIVLIVFLSSSLLQILLLSEIYRFKNYFCSYTILFMVCPVGRIIRVTAVVFLFLAYPCMACFWRKILNPNLSLCLIVMFFSFKGFTFFWWRMII